MDLGLYNPHDPNHSKTIKVSEFIRSNGSWNCDKLQRVLYTNMLKDITSIHILYNNLDDKMLWGYAPNGEYTTKSSTSTRIA